MGGKKYALLLLVAVFLSGLLGPGCLQDYLPQMLQEKEKEEEIIVEEEMGEKEQEDEKEKIPEGMLSFQVYYWKEEQGMLIPVTILEPWKEGVARAALEKLVKGPSPSKEMEYGLTSPLPPTTEIRGVNIKEGLARVDFSSDFLEYNAEIERAVLGSVVHTLLQFPTVSEVELLVEGRRLESYPGGTEPQIFSRNYGLNMEVDDEALNFEETSAEAVVLYFCTLLGEEEIFFVPVTRVVPLGRDNDMVSAAVKELVKGPGKHRGLFSDIPPETELRESAMEGEFTVVLDFSSDLLEYRGGLRGEENIKRQLALTMTELPGIELVQVKIEGEKMKLKYGTSFLDPLARPQLFNLLH